MFSKTTITTQILTEQRHFFQTGKTKNIAFRVEQLKLLKQVIIDNQTEIAQAVQADIKKPKFESIGTEVLLCIEEINYALKKLKSWTKPKKVATPLFLFPTSGRIISEPLGVVLIIGAWNYPFQLVIAPLVGAIAAGNCAILKPSEIAAHTSGLVAKLIGKCFEPNFLAVVEGGKEVSQELLAEKFDHIFFTGSTEVGKIIMQAAAKQLTPVTLELGGKSPCIIEPDIDLELSARRIAWGKFINAGQTCIAPDYLLVHRSIKEPLIAAIKQCIQEFYTENPEASSDYARIISDRHFNRLQELLHSGGKVVVGGETNSSDRYIAPTVIDEVNWDDQIMQAEIFGPLLPVIEYDDLTEAIAQINSRPKPLALYFFSKNKQNQQRILQETSSGGACINETITHIAPSELPFGGVGDSGVGNYGGKASFDTFSHRKSVLKKPFWLDIKLRYPPYEGKLKFINWLLK
ncbi:MAG: aldehyde dehydrogenase [Oscillatoria sp. PMC 1068.18]|nr:aldehyde dehydrogenase [Oscillatoria sp. PMC 1076.18]MEC4991453.1 aldehyde dehydrogenase [Oscillatoria sp. PMC 1068.18]